MWRTYFGRVTGTSGCCDWLYLKWKYFDKKQEQNCCRDAVQPEVEDLWGDQGLKHPPVLGDPLQPGGYGTLSGVDEEDNGYGDGDGDDGYGDGEENDGNGCGDDGAM